MGTFTTKLKLGRVAYGVTGGLDPIIRPLTVGQIRVTESLPNSRYSDDDPCYREEYMCLETGVGSGTIWTYGVNIFATLEEAEGGVIAYRQRMHKQLVLREAQAAEQAARDKAKDLRLLAELKARYEPSSGV